MDILAILTPLLAILTPL